jgi:solute carrier family 25 phosphate transporter 3
MNDPMMARIISPDKPLPATTIPSAAMRMKMPNPNDPNSVISIVQREANNDGKGGAGGCIGRACYDRPVVAVAYARAEKDSYATFRNEDDALKAQKVDDALIKRSAASAKRGNPVVSGSSSGSGPPSLPFWGGGPSTSSQLLSLLPAGIGLQYDEDLRRYVLAVDEDVEVSDDSVWLSMRQGAKPLDPEFGPRGRSPIERDMEIGLETYLRFCLSGAVCSSAVHLALTPIDVVKTKLQTNPTKYRGIVYSFKKVLKEGGPSSFFTGWAPTFLGFFVWGGFSYTMTELLRRYLTAAAGPDAASLEVPIILVASGISAMLGSFVICPFEAVRIRSVAQPDFAPRIDGVLTRMLTEEGISSLFSAVPAFMMKEIPFAMAKFTVFDLSTAWMYDAFPAAREDLQLSLLVSLFGGTLGGTSAALVSNPADATISEMKKAKSDMGPIEAFQKVFARNGIPALFAGWQLRMLFYAMLVSLQFLVYDAVRFALGIGSDDLKVYLDVLGGALQQKGGPV